jgi:hypothetical protein
MKARPLRGEDLLLLAAVVIRNVDALDVVVDIV